MLFQHHIQPLYAAHDRPQDFAHHLTEADVRHRPGPRVVTAAVVVIVVLVASLLAGMTGEARASSTGNTVVRWNQIAEDTVVASGAFQNESLLYLSYASAAVYDALVAIEGGYEPYGDVHIVAAPGASPDAAAITASSAVLSFYFPAQSQHLAELAAASLASIPDGFEKTAGADVGVAAASAVLAMREADGRMTPIGTSSWFPTLTPGPGVWRLAAPAFAQPQTPWLGGVRPFVLRSADQFLPGPPPSLRSKQWVTAFDETKEYGAASSSVRAEAQTATAKFWSANVVRQYNRLVRDLAVTRGLDLLQSARLAAMVNVVGADAQISVMYAKYHYLFWRPVTAIDPTAVTWDGFGPVPGFADGNAATAEQVSWRPLLATPSHPEYPAAHGSITSAVAEVISRFLGTSRIDLDVRGFETSGAAGNLDGSRHFAAAADLRDEIVDARVWAGVHYRFSGLAGVALGRNVARYDLAHAFRANRK